MGAHTISVLSVGDNVASRLTIYSATFIARRELNNCDSTHSTSAMPTDGSNSLSLVARRPPPGLCKLCQHALKLVVAVP